MLVSQLRQISVTPQKRQMGNFFLARFCTVEGWVTYDWSRHLIRTDLTDRLREETAQFIGEKGNSHKIGIFQTLETTELKLSLYKIFLSKSFQGVFPKVFLSFVSTFNHGVHGLIVVIRNTWS